LGGKRKEKEAQKLKREDPFLLEGLKEEEEKSDQQHKGRRKRN